MLDVFYWPVMELLLWGFLSIYLQKFDFGGVNVVTILLGAIIFWDLLSQAQRTVSVTFLEDVWERNFLNIFVSPLTVGEFLVSAILLGLVRIALVLVVMAALAFLFYHFNLFSLGFALIPFIANLLLFGWSLGLFTTGIILRWGTSAQVLAFGFIMLIQPFSAVFYPVSALPDVVQWVAYLLPSTYVFEGMRAVVADGALPVRDLVMATVTNLAYMALVLWYFYAMFAYVKRTGRLMRMD